MYWVFSRNLGGRSTGGNFEFFFEEFRVSRFWIPLAGWAFRNSILDTVLRPVLVLQFYLFSFDGLTLVQQAHGSSTRAFLMVMLQVFCPAGPQKEHCGWTQWVPLTCCDVRRCSWTVLNRDMFKPFRSHSGLLGWVKGCVLEDLHKFLKGFPSERRIYESTLLGQTKLLS